MYFGGLITIDYFHSILYYGVNLLELLLLQAKKNVFKLLELFSTFLEHFLNERESIFISCIHFIYDSIYQKSLCANVFLMVSDRISIFVLFESQYFTGLFEKCVIHTVYTKNLQLFWLHSTF